MRKMAEFREMTDAELVTTLDELKKEKFNLKAQAKSGQLQNSARIKQVKREIARIKTEQTMRIKNAEKQKTEVS
jgi:large subunit ribosomal protein L29